MRKQLLLGTTALLAGAVAMPDYASAEDPLRLSVRGYRNEYFGVGGTNVDGIGPNGEPAGTDYGPTSHFSEGEVHFKGETALDNGLTIGVDVQLEMSQPSDVIDEAYTWIKGDFGKVVLGSENFANYTSFWGVTAPNVGVPINSGWVSTWSVRPTGIASNFRATQQSTNIELRNDNFMASYETPRFAGFSFNVSYAPTSAGGANSGDPKNFFTNEDTENHDVVGLGLNYKESFSGVDVGVAAAYNRATVSDNAGALGANDPQQIKVGANIGVAGFSVGGSYANEFEGQRSASTTTTTTLIAGGGGLVSADANGDGVPDTTSTTALGASTEGYSFDVGASYSTGPWGVSAAYIHGQVEGSVADPDDDELDSVVGAVSYALGPGITTSLSVIYSNWQEEGGNESNATMGIVGLAISF